MTTTDWIIDIALVLIVLRQIREERLTFRFVALPLALVGYTFFHYISAVPTGGNNLVLLTACVAVGAALGTAGGLTTKVRGENGEAFVRAGWTAASLWVGSMGARLAFIVWITHPSGAAALTNFSIDHDITSGSVWQTSILLLALSEVVVRLGLIVARGQRAKRASAITVPAAKVLVAA